MAVVVQPGSGREFKVDDSQVEFWAKRGYAEKKAPARKAKSKTEGKDS